MTILEISRKERHQKKSEYQLFCVEGDGVLVKTNSGSDEKHNTDLSHFLTHTVTNLDNGKGHTRRAFQNIQKSLKIHCHEHFWNAYHVKEKINQFFKPYLKALKEMMFKTV